MRGFFESNVFSGSAQKYKKTGKNPILQGFSWD